MQETGDETRWQFSTAVALPQTSSSWTYALAQQRVTTETTATHANPDGQWEGTDDQERPVRLSWWKHLHVKDARYLDLTVIRVERPHASNTERDPRVSWFVWIGDPEVDLVSLGLGYVLRFSHEHGYRFQKQSLRLRSAASAHS